MQTMNVSLTPAQAEYARRVVERDYGNASEFFRELLRERMEREIAADVELLRSTSRGANAGPSADELAEAIAVQKSVRRKLHESRA